ncbi:ABC transporter substrate-binding protein [Mucilaginibacter sp. BJC16-A38]|uniref:ABC transporter substrate-binding protein n=1 Tax=Mucilaginibacter phenanthrenivorans TaxID=1234842 RepID=UPI002157A617|nr:ABC transporter substrate-binding protein [Mucilaginibacter phenanthrenivorans]MCR8561444.1 ABC transporter substrate-binding protein [Mucilaginibacter phenanthrenivorans]
MISAQNRLLRLSGNRWLMFLFIGLIAAACSPKLQPVAVQPKKGEEKKIPFKTPPKSIVQPNAPKVSTIAMLLPFGLDHLRAGSPYTATTLKEADISLDYYRGFKLALDSLTGQGYNFKLQLFDSKGEKAQAHSLALNPAVRSSDLIVGPVFPEDVKAFTGAFPSARQPIVSPLSPASPATIKSPVLVTMLPPLEYHAWGAAAYIADKINPKKVFVLKSGYSEENDYLIPFKKAIDSLSKKHIQVVYLTVIHGQVSSLIPQLSSTGRNVFIIPATNQHFLTVTLRGLDSLTNSYPVTVFGHPSWANFSFLKADLLQRLDTHITAADRINYKDANTVAFMKSYRAQYHIEPGEYAVKGFDEGLYWGQQLANGDLKNLSGKDYEGLHNNFHFQKKAGLGWINTHINIYKYTNFELKKVE